LNFSFFVDGVKYYFKYDSLINSYSELVMEEIGLLLKIPCVSYDLAIVGNVKGVLSRSFEKDDGVILLGLDLVKEYYGNRGDVFSISLNSGSDTTNFEIYNNLEAIWEMLESRYKNHPDRDKVVTYLMGSLVRYLLFAFLTGQSDQHLGNWGIIEYDDGRIEFLPFYDNERFMSSSPAVLTLRFFVSRDITYVNKYNLFLSGTLKDNFDYFQKVSCLEYTLVLQEALGLLSDESLKYIIDRIEKKTQAKMPNDIQNDLFSRFKEHRKFLEIILNDKSRVRKRF